ncbi:MAG: radical SAM family heme chaperone HemW [Chitinophagaceae bacterium]
MAGIYIHVPFCKKACHYCNFHFSTSLSLRDAFFEALSKEIKLSASRENDGEAYLGDEVIETIYFGGGTPSLLEKDELNTILSQLFKYYNIDTKAEITFEANPDDISIQKLKEWKIAGINRLSIGIQSFFNEHLTWMNRAHTAGQAFNALKSARQQGFDNISIDLIYGTPDLHDDQWKHNVQLAIDMGIPHLSCYALTVESSTALQKMIQQKKSADVDPEKQAAQFLMLVDWAEEAGYEHYEISNFAKPGKRSNHNSSYWQGKKYLGLGPSAHSFNGISRQWNISNNALYIQSLKHNILSVEKEILTPDQRLNEYIMTSLRTMEGIKINYVESQFGKEAASHILNLTSKYVDDKKIKFWNDSILLTRDGKLYADGIAADLFK